MKSAWPLLRLASVYAIAAACVAHAVSAEAGPKRYDVGDPAYRQECGSCHVPFPPALLSAPSWRAVMGDLGRHFGADAALDEAPRAAIAAFLQRGAGVRDTSTAGQPLLRVSETAWFAKEHRRHLTPAVLARADVKSASNCAACHPGAEQGRYDERDLRVPGGGAK